MRWAFVPRCPDSPSCLEEFFSEIRSTEGSNPPHTLLSWVNIGVDFAVPERGVEELFQVFIHTLYEYAKTSLGGIIAV